MFSENGLSLGRAVGLARLAFFFVDFQQLIKSKTSGAVELEVFFNFTAHGFYSFFFARQWLV
jgi:hypothetical protein